MKEYPINMYDLEAIHKQRRLSKQNKPKIVIRQKNLYDLLSRTKEIK